MSLRELINAESIVLTNISSNQTNDFENNASEVVESSLKGKCEDVFENQSKWESTIENNDKWNEIFENQDIDYLYSLIKQGAPYLSDKIDGWGPLGLAAFCCRYDIIKFIITRFENETPSDETKALFQKQGGKALFETCESNCGHIAELLMKTGIDFKPNEHPHHAAKYGSWVVLDSIFKHYGDIYVDVENEYSETPLQIAAKFGFVPAVRYLLEQNADPNRVNMEGNSALHLACIQGNPEIVKLLVSRGAEVNKLDNENRVPVSYASEHGYSNIISILANAKADLDRRDRNGNVPLILSAKNGHTSTMKELIVNGASLEVVDSQRFNALENAIHNRRDATAAAYIRIDPNINFIKDFVDKVEISNLAIIKWNMTETTAALLDRMVHPSNKNQIDKAIVVTRYLDLDSNDAMPDSEDYDENKATLLQRIAEVGEERLAYHGVVRILVDRKMKQFGNYFLIVKFIFYILFLFLLGYSLVQAANEVQPGKSYTRSAENIIRILAEIYVLLYLIFNIFTEAIEFIRVAKFTRVHLKDRIGQKQKEFDRKAEVAEHIVEGNFDEKIKSKGRKQLQQIYHFFFIRLFIDYFKDLSNLMDILGLGSILILILLRLTFQPTEWIFATVAFFINSLRLFKLITLVPTFGPYSIIILQILKRDVPKFGMLFLITLVIYSTCFFIALRVPFNALGFQNGSINQETVRIEGIDDQIWWVSLSGFRILMEGNIIGTNYLYNHYNWLACTIYLGFLFLIVVVYLNVFIAQLSDTYSITKQQAAVNSAVFRLHYIVQLQKTSLLSLCTDIRKKTFIPEVTIGKEDFINYFGVSNYPAFVSKLHSDDSDLSAIISRVSTEQKVDRRLQEISIRTMRDNLEFAEERASKNIQTRLEMIENNMGHLYKGTSQVECRLDRIEESLNKIAPQLNFISNMAQSIEDLKTMIASKN